jgi:hypothetical protein
LVNQINKNEIVVHVAPTGTGNFRIGFWLADLRERVLLGALGIDGRIILITQKRIILITQKKTYIIKMGPQ